MSVTLRTLSGGRRAVVALMMLVIASTIALPLREAEAARASKPKEIVVVGSKVKEVIREAGLRSEGNLVAALSNLVRDNMGAAMDRAEKNGRYRLRAFDLSCPTPPERDDPRMTKADLVETLATSNGFTLGRDFQDALNAYALGLLDEAIARARGNNRSTVRPHDL